MLSRHVLAGVIAIYMMPALPLFGAESVHTTDPDTGIESWEIHTQGVSLWLAQILPDQVRGFYSARGFDAESVELLATGACVFQTIFRNESAKRAIEFNLADWRVLTAKGEQPLRLERDWQQ